mgnify:CR=1 FL=1
MLRDYQQRAIDQLYEWMRNNSGHPCLVLPTGAGKSHIIAALCKDALQNWPETRILMLTHVKELIEQNAEKMRQHWKGAPMGIYSASLNSKQLGEPITFAGIQSIRGKAELVGHIDLCVIDECHLVNHKEEGGYRTFISELLTINPQMRVIGLSATPYRLGHGLITDKPAIFDSLVEPVSIEELLHKGHLAPLRSKTTTSKLDVSGVAKRGGEYIESELQAAVNNEPQNQSVVSEIIARAEGRTSWLVFCSGVDHARHICAILLSHGINAACVTGETPKSERADILAAFKAKKIQALTNANVLTTGFDAPDTDLIALLRPTMSPALYMQMVGRGLRPKSHTDHCLVLDFAGNIALHGPVTAVKTPEKQGQSSVPGFPPTKACEFCGEIVHAAVRVCPACQQKFPEPEPPKLELRDDDIMGKEGTRMFVKKWVWRNYISRSSGKNMLKVDYYGVKLSDPVVSEYLCVLHVGYAGEKALRQLAYMVKKSGMHHDGLTLEDDLDQVADYMNHGTPPTWIEFQRDGRFFQVQKREWDDAATMDGTGLVDRMEEEAIDPYLLSHL